MTCSIGVLGAGGRGRTQTGEGWGLLQEGRMVRCGVDVLPGRFQAEPPSSGARAGTGASSLPCFPGAHFLWLGVRVPPLRPVTEAKRHWLPCGLGLVRPPSSLDGRFPSAGTHRAPLRTASLPGSRNVAPAASHGISRQLGLCCSVHTLRDI